MTKWYWQDRKEILYNHYRNLFLSNIHIDFSDTTINENFVKDTIFNIGSCCIVDNKMIGLMAVEPIYQQFNYYNMPITVACNIKNVGYFTYNEFSILQYNINKKPIAYVLNNFIDLILDIEKVIRLHLKHYKIPRIWNVADEKELNNIKSKINKIDNDVEDLIFIKRDLTEFKLETTTEVNFPYLIDKLYNYKKELENELLSLLGIDNVNVNKASGVSSEEVSSNNEEIQENKEALIYNLEKGLKDTNKIFGTNFKVTLKNVSENIGEDDDLE